MSHPVRQALSLVAWFVLASLLGLGGAEAQKRYANEALAPEVLRLDTRVRAEGEPGNRAAADWVAEANAAQGRNNWRGVVRALQAAAALEPQNVTHLIRLAEAYARVDFGNDWNLRNDYEGRSTAAAYAAYLRARTPADEARALAALAEAFVRRSQFRDALNALRIAVDTQATPQMRNRYAELLDEHGFRVLDYRVDSDAASPRACFELSEPVPPRFDATPFVRMPAGIPGAVTASGNQVCVDGLRHGERYEITLRQGLPSTVGEVLRRDTQNTIYVRDRRPLVRFTGRNYVLPRTGQQGIPVVTVNLAEVGLTVYRIGDRSIAPTILDEGFLQGLTGEAARRIADQSGVQVWTGVMQTEARLNEEVTTAFPVGDAVGERLAPGIYVMLARRTDVRAEDDFERRATQWFVVSDLGVSTVSAQDGLTVQLRSLATATPLEGVDLRLVARNNEVLGTARTDARGLARFERALTQGQSGTAPGVLVASRDGDYTVLNLAATAFDLTDRGVTGRTPATPLDAFVVTERGVYRSGERVFVTALLRDSAGAAVPNVPLILTVERGDGQEVRRIQLPDQGLGGRVWTIELPIGATNGTWRIKAFADPRRPPIGEATFLVEDYVPERLELALETPARTVAAGAAVPVEVRGRFLYGAPAADLALEGEIILQPAPNPPPGLEGYRVGLADDTPTPIRRPLDGLGRTDREGRARLQVPVTDLPVTSRPLQADVMVRLAETSGRGVERRVSLPVIERRPFVGVRPAFQDNVQEGETAQFDVVILGADGRLAAARGVRWELSRIETRFQWLRTDGRWTFESVTNARRVADGRVDVAPGAPPTRISAAVEWGRYRLDVTYSEGGQNASTSVIFNAGWSGGELRADAPDVLEVALDKERYAAGETARLRVEARFDGEATVHVVSDRVLETRQVAVRRGANSIDVPVGTNWGAGAYVVVTAFRPLDVAARRQPGRAIGVRWLGIDPAPRTIGVTIDAPQTVRPRERLTVPIRLANLAGEQARVVVSAVDVGILNLTRYRTPDPAGWAFGQRALSAELRDLYGFLIDGMAGVRGRIRSGGDAPAIDRSLAPQEAPLALFSGIVEVGADGIANVSFDIPPFAGTVRVMATAWTVTKAGSAERDVIVRDPVVLTGTLPRFLAAGDRSRFMMEVHNVEGPAGEYRIDVDIAGPVVLPADALSRTVRLDRGQRTVVQIPVTAAGMGRGTFDVTVTGPDGAGTGRSYGLSLLPATPVTARRTVRTLAPGASITFGPDMLADIIPGTGAVTVSIGPPVGLDAPGLVEQLARYPLECTEQLISRTFPLLYLSNLGEERAFRLDRPAAETVRDTIERILLRQSSNGSFGLWGTGGEDAWLDAYAADFLTRARERGYTVPRAAFDLVLDRLRNAVVNQTGEGQDTEPSAALAYAIYVLARNNHPVIGDLRYLSDARAEDIATPLAQAQVGAALALVGDRTRAGPLFTRALEALDDAEEGAREDYGSILRDAAGVAALMFESNAEARLLARALALVERRRQDRRTLSTQEKMWMTLAAQAGRAAAERQTLDVDGAAHNGAYLRTFRADDFTGRPVTVRNTGQTASAVVVTVTGSRVTPEAAEANGFELQRTYHRLDGTRVDPRAVRQNERLLVVLRVTEAEPRFGRLMLIDRLPAGFEVDSPALVEGARLTGVGVPASEERPAYTEFRDDRFVAAFDRRDGASGTFAVAYIARVVAPGSYAHPGAYLEDMYAPERFARTAAGIVEVAPAQ